MTFSLAEFKTELQYLYDQAKTNTGAESWSRAYGVLFGLISVDDQGRAILSHAPDGSIVDRNGVAVNLDSFVLSNADEAAAQPAEGVDPAAWVFLRGVSDVNAGVGDFSTFIREYSKAQYIMRFGEGDKTSNELDALVQTTSDAIAQSIFHDILSLDDNGVPTETNPLNELPNVQRIADQDAQAAAKELFTESEIAGWAGNPLFILLGVDGPFRTNILHESSTGEVVNYDTGDVLSMISAMKTAAAALGIADFLFGIKIGGNFFWVFPPRKLNYTYFFSFRTMNTAITVPFQSRKSWRGAVVIQPASENSKDTIDLPPHELRDLIRGVIWRDEHFNGMTIRDLAAREGHSEVFVGRLIHRTFEIT